MATEASSLLGVWVVLALGVGGFFVVGACLPRRRVHQVVIVTVMPAPTPTPTPTPWTVLVSPDGRYWWDGTAWIDAACVAPAGAVCSPDGTRWWSGQEWLPRAAALPPSTSPDDEPPWWQRVRTAETS